MPFTSIQLIVRKMSFDSTSMRVKRIEVGRVDAPKDQRRFPVDMNPKSLISAVSRFSEKIDPIDIVARLTLLLLLLSDWMVGDDWQFKVSLRLLALVGMLVPGRPQEPLVMGSHDPVDKPQDPGRLVDPGQPPLSIQLLVHRTDHRPLLQGDSRCDGF